MILTFWKIVSVSAMCTSLTIVALATLPSNAEAREYEGWSPSFATDSTWSLYIDYCTPGDVIWWYWESSDSLGFWLVNTPSMVSIQGFTNWDGYLVEDAGWYNLVWYNNNLFFWADVFYSVEVFRPAAAVVTAPVGGTYVDTSAIDIRGTYDTRAEGVLVGSDALHLKKAMTEGADWAVDNLGLGEGLNEILVRTYYFLDGDGYRNHTVDTTLNIVVDTVSPTVNITTPVSSSTTRGNYADISWQCSDEVGIAKVEVKIDGWGWGEIQGTTYNDVRLSNGEHTVGIRVTDLAGNQATDSVTFEMNSQALSFGGPYYGLPTIAIILVIVIAVLVVTLMLRKKKGGPAVASVPEEEPATQVP